MVMVYLEKIRVYLGHSNSVLGYLSKSTRKIIGLPLGLLMTWETDDYWGKIGHMV